MRSASIKLLTMVAVTAATLAFVSDAEAFNRHRSWGSSGGSWGSSGGSWGSSGGSWGSSRGHVHVKRHRVKRHRRWGSSGGSWGSSGGSWGSSGGSWGSSGGSWGSRGGTVIESDVDAPAEGDAPYEAEAADEGSSTRFAPSRTSAELTLNVPADAKVTINGKLTVTTGTVRHYVSRGLRPGSSYRYSVSVEVSHNGVASVENKTVELAAGENQSLAMGTSPKTDNVVVANVRPMTTLVVHVPDDARVLLSGKEARATGPVRRFSTSKLAGNDKWDNYVVEAAIERDGKTVTKRQVVSLQAGETREIRFDFDQPSLVDKVATVLTR